MTTSQEKIAGTMQSQLNAQQQQWISFANNAMDCSIQLFELNCQAAKAAFDETTSATQRMLAARTPQAWLSLDSEILRENIQQGATYVSAIQDVNSRLQAQLTEATMANVETSRNFAGTLSKAGRDDVSVASGNPAELMKSTLETVSNGYARWIEANQKVVDSMTNGRHIDTPNASNGKRKASKATAQ
ncbi:MAG TPA: phasin family protein [Burkholderiaceae bacterium]|jgi:phasin family protein